MLFALGTFRAILRVEAPRQPYQAKQITVRVLSGPAFPEAPNPTCSFKLVTSAINIPELFTSQSSDSYLFFLSQKFVSRRTGGLIGSLIRFAIAVHVTHLGPLRLVLGSAAALGDEAGLQALPNAELISHVPVFVRTGNESDAGLLATPI